MLRTLSCLVTVTVVSGIAAKPQDAVPGRLIVQHRTGTSDNDSVRIFAAHGAKIQKHIQALQVHVLSVPEQAIDAISEHLRGSGLFTFVERDYFAHQATIPNDPSYGSQWHLTKIQASDAWTVTTGATSIPIAVIDSGVDRTHPDLSGKITAGWNFLGGNTDTSDVLGHGTAVSGAAAASTNNGIGVAGVAWNNPIMPLVVLSSGDYASYSDIASAITYATDHSVRIINISICGTAASSVLQSAVDYAWSKGALVIAAAGNNNSSAPNYPAACNNALAVSSTESDDTRSGFSNYGSWVDISAPGNFILTTKNGGTYSQWYGTSFSSPIVSGVAALVLSVRPSLSNTALVDLLEKNSDDLGTAGYDSFFGWGRINAYRAVSAATAISSDATPPNVTLNSPMNNSVVSGAVAIQGSASDNVGVTRLEWWLDGNLKTASVANPFNFSWDTTTSTNGPHSLTVKAYDLAGNVGVSSATVSVNNPVIADLQPPTVSITSPANGSRVGQQMQISVAAADNVAVSQVSVYVDGVQVYTATAAPYQFTLRTKAYASGAHTVTARAWDRAGNIASSAPVTVYK